MSNTGRSGDDMGVMDTGECECKGEGIIQALNAWLSTVTYSSPTSPRHIGHIFFLL